jgi:hypothetical protein
MENLIPTFGPIDFDALADYLLSDHAPDDCMGLSDLDGFLTDIVVRPELTPPGEWLPVIWVGMSRSLKLKTRCGRSLEPSWAATTRSSPASTMTRNSSTRSSGRGRRAM